MHTLLFLSLLIQWGITESMWDAESGREISHATMSLENFHIISMIISFDNRDNRTARRNERQASYNQVSAERQASCYQVSAERPASCYQVSAERPASCYQVSVGQVGGLPSPVLQPWAQRYCAAYAI
ncbi:unnamed protein product [Oncorhynchus mykiss]|uniref:Secreted protein n=1 Tax=Oncorhynchus mykiss TaxID=8022 RepID=A0A060YQM2_ONCMY|nr:unnamed protein product [Oncorhynchus mykiss]